MNSRSTDPAAALAVLALLIVGAILYSISKDIGASFAVVVQTFFGWLSSLCVLGGLLWWGFDWIASAAGVSILAWLLTWPLLNSMAHGGQDPDAPGSMAFLYDAPWWNEGAFKWATLGALIIVTGYRVWHLRNR